eukprot:RCo015429
MTTVSEVRDQLTQQQNRKYKDYQLERWIAHKKGRINEVLRTVGNQHFNECRVMSILTNPSRLQATVHELNRRVLSFIHLAESHRVVIFVNTRNKSKQFCEDEAIDALLLFMYYSLLRIEELEGDGKSVELVVDMSEGDMPSTMELRAQAKMFSGVLGRSFPKFYSELLMCCAWGAFVRKGITTLAHATGLRISFLTPVTLLERFGSQYMPTFVGGELDVSAGPPIGDIVEKYFFENSRDPKSPLYRLFPIEEVRQFAANGGGDGFEEGLSGGLLSPNMSPAHSRTNSADSTTSPRVTLDPNLLLLDPEVFSGGWSGDGERGCGERWSTLLA